MAEAPDELDILFDEAIERTIASLPEPYVERLGSVAIVVEDEPTPAQLASVGAHGLYGLYQGVPRTRWGVDNVGRAEQDHAVPRAARPVQPVA